MPVPLQITGPFSQGSSLIFGEEDGPGDSPAVRLNPPYANADAARNYFMAQLTNPGTETFEGFADGDGAAAPLELDFGYLTAVIDDGAGGTGGFVNRVHPTNLAGRYAAYGPPGETDPAAASPEPWAYFDTRSNGATLTFSAPVRAIGFYLGDAGDFAGHLVVRLNFQDATSEDITIPHLFADPADSGAPYGGSMCYVGIIAVKDFLSVELLNDSVGSDIFAFDNFTVATSAHLAVVVPDCGEPRTRVPECVDTLSDQDIIGGRWLAGDSQIINRVIFSVDWDPDLGDFTKHVIFTAEDSVTRYGPRPPLLIPSKGMHTTGCAGNDPNGENCTIKMMRERAYAVFARYADPTPTLELEIFYRKHLWEAGDLICVTSRFLPNLVTGKRGYDDEIFEVINVRMDFAPQGKVVVSLLDIEAISLPRPPRIFITEDDAALPGRLNGQLAGQFIPSALLQDGTLDDGIMVRVME